MRDSCWVGAAGGPADSAAVGWKWADLDLGGARERALASDALISSIEYQSHYMLMYQITIYIT